MALLGWFAQDQIIRQSGCSQAEEGDEEQAGRRCSVGGGVCIGYHFAVRLDVLSIWDRENSGLPAAGMPKGKVQAWSGPCQCQNQGARIRRVHVSPRNTVSRSRRAWIVRVHVVELVFEVAGA